MPDEIKRWLVRTPEGQILGPYSTADIITRIKNSRFSGEEEITIYPGGRWFSISGHPEFYDELLEAIAQQSQRSSERSISEVQTDEPAGNEDPSLSDIRYDPPKDSDSKKDGSDPEKGQTNFSDRTYKSAIVDGAAKRFDPEKDKIESSVIELKERGGVVKKARAKSFRTPLIVLAVTVIAFLIFDSIDFSRKGGQQHLIPVRVNQPALSAADVKTHLKRGISFFVKDTHNDYQKAESEFVEALEGDPKKPETWSMLCLTYFQLWPFSAQDRRDLTAVAEAQSIVSSLNPGGIHAVTCRVVYQFVKGSYGVAKGQVDAALDKYSNIETTPVHLYYFKAELLKQANEASSALAYVNSAQKMWPQWLKLYSLEGELLIKSNRLGDAANKYRSILKAYNKHTASQLQLGILESRHFGHPEKAKSWLSKGLKNSEKVDSVIVSNAYLTLGEIYLREGDRSRALGYAKRSFQKNSRNRSAKELMVSLSGQEGLQNTKLADRDLVYQGDLFLREGNCNAAQAHYKSAYEVNKKNASAAFKAAKCLWQLSFSTEAIEWLNKSIKADPKYIEAYVLLADYYSQRFDYHSAAKVLRKASRIKVKSFEVYRGYALLALRQNGVKDAIRYARKADLIYGSDSETQMILSKAYLLAGDTKLAFASATKAIEIDMNNYEAQITYAKSLAALQGTDSALTYMVNLVTRYPTILDYRIALANMYLEDQRYQAAVEVFNQVVQIERKPKEAYLGLGKAFIALGQMNEALDAFLRAAVTDPADPRPLFEAGLLYLRVNKGVEARNQFKRVLSINSMYPLAYYYVGQSEMVLRNYKGALAAAEKEKRSNPNFIEPYLLAAEAYTKMRKFGLCASEYQKALRFNPSGAEVYIKVAQCYRQTGNTDVALSMLNRAKQIESGNPELYKQLGAIYEIKNSLNLAIEAYERYLMLNPGAKDAGLVRAKIQSLQGGRGY